MSRRPVNLKTIQELESAHSILQVVIEYPDPPLSYAVTGTGVVTLQPPTGYVNMTNAYSVSQIKGRGLADNGDGRILVKSTGVVDFQGYLSMTSDVNNSTLAATVTLQRGMTVVYGTRGIVSRAPNAGDLCHIAGVALIDVLKDDIIGIGIACDKTCNISPIVANALVKWSPNQVHA